MRKQQGFPGTALPTLLVLSLWSERVRVWKPVTEDIAKSISPGTEIQVEVIAPELYERVFYHPW
jgi:hypothetical protein